MAASWFSELMAGKWGFQTGEICREHSEGLIWQGTISGSKMIRINMQLYKCFFEANFMVQFQVSVLPGIFLEWFSTSKVYGATWLSLSMRSLHPSKGDWAFSNSILNKHVIIDFNIELFRKSPLFPEKAADLGLDICGSVTVGQLAFSINPRAFSRTGFLSPT